ncbi:ABC transporter permease [Sphaerobacter thermophilus]|mgnify:CR=1 FL=1|jgi:peptide/nickel transport system permease protein|uniref:Binding-protein-dependent transport systems inner membrane component n=1 Tax=Sphaerobacter thermophilus (strain ATCC 49802 / DSM 20745 / KCCM 41009 / NCIMB 13125 / S 6022) TaxID=479434 RepID=D1C964_SPHTD|nr:ABC transporter permease [Sphaerobacter thermophilus]ACZ40357.1 binding-protein-dependent transport systems inner membrane component [Sphaerobacter thermophilus DSM 20745]PZN66287.1 MAG: ABC transporter permease [Sphaerobacter thermophilus]
MGRFIIRRLLQSILVVFGVTLLVFVVLFKTGDPVILLVSPDATKEEIEQVRRELGFDRPWYVQYADFMTDALRGDFGISLRQKQPVFKLVVERIPATLELAIAAFIISIVVAVPVGIISATQRNSIWDNLSMGFALLGQSLPVFFLGVMLIFIFAGQLKVLPSYGRGDGTLVGELRHLILPAVTLATFTLARTARLVRSSLLEVLGLEYVKTARAKGLAERVVILRHALQNAMIPVVTVLGLELGTLLGGAVITETVFAWPGVGRLVINAIQQRDFPVVVGAVTLVAVMFVVINLVVDVLYGVIDPRVRYS